MKNATLLFLINRESKKVLLGMKKKGFGKGKYNGFGGKIEPDENIKDAAIREILEECKVDVKADDLKDMGEIKFFFPHRKEVSWDFHVHLFISEKWAGEPSETDEMKPVWFNWDDIPLDNMWQDDKHWLPKVLDNKKVIGEFTFDIDDESIVHFKLDEI